MVQKNRKPTRPWQEIAADAQLYRDDSIKHHSIQPPVPALPSSDKLPKSVFALLKDHLGENERAVTEMVPEELLAKLAAGRVTAVDVSMAFLRRAGIVQGLVCAMFCFPLRFSI